MSAAEDKSGSENDPYPDAQDDEEKSAEPAETDAGKDVDG